MEAITRTRTKLIHEGKYAAGAPGTPCCPPIDNAEISWIDVGETNP